MRNTEKVVKEETEMQLGEYVTRKPKTILGEGTHGKQMEMPMRGRVVYIHPRGRYHVAEFDLPGGPVRESFPGV